MVGNMHDTISFGIWLRQKRRALDLTQKAFAAEVGCAEITVRRMEADDYRPSKELALALFEKLGIPEPERLQWVRFARGQAEVPDRQHLPSLPRTQVNNLPAPLTSFIRREQEQEEIIKLLSEVRLVSVIGPGGIGKTRLSLQVSQELLGKFPDGVWFVPVATLQSTDALLPAIAKILNFSFYQEEERPRQQLLDYLREKQLLLVLDSFEQLVNEGGELIGEILMAARHVKMLITSRQRLNLQGEHLYRVSGMRIPEPSDIARRGSLEEQAKNFSALQLFEERARRVRQDFQLTQDNLSAVIEICKLVDGMPLGIELAAAWVEILTPSEIAAEFRHSLNLLKTNQKDVPDRQRSIRAIFESSWNMLGTKEKKVFQRLTVFRGSFSREAAQYVARASLWMLLGLAKKSWLQQVGEGHFLLHNVLRQYGHEHLRATHEEWWDTNVRHANYYVDFVARQEQELRGKRQIEAANILNREFSNNIQAAWNWLIESKRFGDLVNKMLPGLFHFSMIRSQGEMLIPWVIEARKAIPDDGSREKLLQRAILETVETYFEVERIILDDKPQEQLVNLWAQVQESGLSREMGFWFVVLYAAYREGLGFHKRFKGFRELLDTITVQDDPWLTGYSLLLLAGDIMAEASPPEAQKFLEQALKIFQEKGAIHEQALALSYLGQNAWDQNSFGELRRYQMAAQELFAKAEDYFRVGSIWLALAQINTLEGNLDQAVLAYHEQRRAFEKIGFRRGLGFSFSWESIAASRYGTLDHALQTRLKSLEFAREVGHHNDIGWATWELGEVYRLMGDYEQACLHYQQSFPLFEELPDFNGLGFYYRGLGEVALELEQWTEARYQFQKSIEVLEQEHRYMRPWSIGYAQIGLGLSLIGLRNFSEARQVLQDSIRNGECCGHVDLMLVSLVGFARLYTATGSFESGIELATFVLDHPLAWNEVKKRAFAVIEAASNDLPEDIILVSQARGQAITLEQAVAFVSLDS